MDENQKSSEGGQYEVIQQPKHRRQKDQSYVAQSFPSKFWPEFA
ncbi:MAG: hypothetical protein QW146_00140 [Candidatus Bathyarchaeia archaeon]